MAIRALHDVEGAAEAGVDLYRGRGGLGRAGACFRHSRILSEIIPGCNPKFGEEFVDMITQP